MKSLTRPDELVNSITAGMHVVILGEEGALLTAAINQFEKRSVMVSVISNLEEHANDEQIKASLNALAEEKGSIDGFLYLVSDNNFDVTASFFYAKHLSRYFHRSEHPSRKAFVIAISLDGAFGLLDAQNGIPEIGSLTGLVKTLHQEWPWVFTRIIDFAPELAPRAVASQILAEWTGADSRLVEIGITKETRQTIEFEEISIL